MSTTTASSTGFNWQSATFDLLKFGISKKYDAEQRETIIIRDPTVQYEANDAGNVQQVGTAENANPLNTSPTWVKWGVVGGLLLGGAALVARSR